MSQQGPASSFEAGAAASQGSGLFDLSRCVCQALKRKSLLEKKKKKDGNAKSQELQEDLFKKY